MIEFLLLGMTVGLVVAFITLKPKSQAEIDKQLEQEYWDFLDKVKRK